MFVIAMFVFSYGALHHRDDLDDVMWIIAIAINQLGCLMVRSDPSKVSN